MSDTTPDPRDAEISALRELVEAQRQQITELIASVGRLTAAAVPQIVYTPMLPAPTAPSYPGVIPTYPGQPNTWC